MKLKLFKQTPGASLITINFSLPQRAIAESEQLVTEGKVGKSGEGALNLLRFEITDLTAKSTRFLEWEDQRADVVVGLVLGVVTLLYA